MKQLRRGYRGAGSGEGIRMTELIHPCSREQPERRFRRNRGDICFWQPPKHPPLPHKASAITRLNLLCEAFVDGAGAVGEILILQL
ncbi:MAG: hypothetical protein D5R99_00535 [Methanocalculus sp. MSAO_Arc1]|nr:MAG: hypothetical protein D5R99_00535 [Methanocalculus sp. MSAO_Arc1]